MVKRRQVPQPIPIIDWDWRLVVKHGLKNLRAIVVYAAAYISFKIFGDQ